MGIAALSITVHGIESFNTNMADSTSGQIPKGLRRIMACSAKILL